MHKEYKSRASIIIPVFNNLDFTKRCLKSLFESIESGSKEVVTFEVIVVDNGSFDGTSEWIQSMIESDSIYSKIVYLKQETNLGFAKGCNSGAQIAQGKYLIFLNNDTEVFPEAIETLISVAARNSGIGVVGCRLLYPNRTIQHVGMALNSNLDWLHVFRGYPAEHPAVMERKAFQAVTGACFLIPKELFFQVNQFDEGYLNSYEDIDLCFKVRAAGRSVIYEPNAVLFHLEGMSSGRSVGEDKNRERFFSRWKDQVRVDYYEHTDRYLEKAIMKAEIETIGLERELLPSEQKFILVAKNLEKYLPLWVNLATKVMLQHALLKIESENLQARLDRLEVDVHQLKRSTSYRLGFLLLAPFRFLKTIFTRF